MNFSLDGDTWHVCRVCAPVFSETVKAGLEAQCSTGNGGMRSFGNVAPERHTVEDIRVGK